MRRASISAEEMHGPAAALLAGGAAIGRPARGAVRPGRRAWWRRHAGMAGGGEGGGGAAGPPCTDGTPSLGPEYPYLHPSLGPPDCCLAGSGWRLPAHKAVLQARCDLLRAHMGSGMRDSDAVEYAVPDVIESREAMEAVLWYVYRDERPPGGIDASLLPQVLHAGIYYGCHRLVALCEEVLAAELVAAGQDGSEEVVAAAAESAGPLLQLADDSGLEQLRAIAVQFIVDRFARVVATESYQALPRRLVDFVTAAAVDRHAHLVEELRQLALQDQ